MSRLSAGVASLARRAGLGRQLAADASPERRGRQDWRQPLDDALLLRLERVAVAAQRSAAAGLGGEHRSRARATSTDFADYRHYRAGDDFRQIDWNAYGRLNQLYVKLTEARERLPLHLLIDCSASMALGSPSKLMYARQLAAVVGYVALARYDRFELVRLGGQGSTLRPLRGKQRFGELLEALDSFVADGSVDVDDLLYTFRPAGVAGQVLFVSDMLHPDGYRRGLEALAAQGLAPSVIQVLSPDEVAPESGGDLELVDVESAERVEVGLSPIAIETYRRRLTSWCADIASNCAALGARYVRVSTDQPVGDVALVTLREAGILA